MSCHVHFGANPWQRERNASPRLQMYTASLMVFLQPRAAEGVVAKVCDKENEREEKMLLKGG